MKVILYIAITANGMIARENDSTPWSDIIFNGYYSFGKELGNIVVGHKTYQLMLDTKTEFEKLGNPVTVVLSSTKLKLNNKNHFSAKTPKEALNILENQGFKIALVGGGGKINSSFMKNSLVDEIVIQIEPAIFGRGVKLFADNDFEANLELMNIKKLSKNEIQLHYKVKEIVDGVKEF